MKIGLIGFGKTGKAVASTLLKEANISLEWVYRKSAPLGSDFDGALLPECLRTPAEAAGLYQYFISRGLSQDKVEGIMYKNAETFFQKNLG